MKKSISLILIFSLLNLTFSGCSSSKLISVDEATQMKQSKNFLIVHDKSKKYLLVNYEFTDTQLKGELTRYSSLNGYNIHVYTTLNFNYSVTENSRIDLTLNRSDISKITYEKFKTGATVFLIVGVLAGIIAIVYAAYPTDSNTAPPTNFHWGF